MITWKNIRISEQEEKHQIKFCPKMFLRADLFHYGKSWKKKVKNILSESFYGKYFLQKIWFSFSMYLSIYQSLQEERGTIINSSDVNVTFVKVFQIAEERVSQKGITFFDFILRLVTI